MAYNDYIVIEQKSVSADAYGERDSTWTTYKSLWAEMEVPGGGLSYESEMPVYSDSRVWKIHTHDAPAVTTKMELVHDSKRYKIHSIQKIGRLHTVLIAEAYDDE